MSLKKALLSSSSLRLQESCASQAALDRALDHLEQVASVIHLDPNETLLQQGEEGDRLYLVVEGTVVAKDEASKVVLHTFNPGDRFGERWLLFAHEPAGATCVAGDQGATLKCVSRETFQQDFGNNFVATGPFRGRLVRAKTTRATRYLERDVCEFRGIEYATREQRYDLPELKEYNTAEIVDAFEDGPECAQIGGALFDQLVPPTPKRSRPSLLRFTHVKEVNIPNERCLVLNVFTPTGATGGISSKKLPVMVFIHGGAFVTGSCSVPMYNGRELASKGTVVITINYRLGALGWLAGAPGVPLNLGLHDQVTALRWVKKNVHLFGGDAGNVTCFGESAGAMSVTCLLGLKVRRQENLFQKAIVQSGNVHAVFCESQGRKAYQTFSAALIDHMRLPKNTIVDKSFLDSAPLDAILKATETTARGIVKSEYLRGVLMPFQPTCFENGPITEDLLFECVPPLVQISRGIASDVTLLTGLNNNEYSLFMLDNSWRRMLAKSNNSKKAFKQLLKDRLLSWTSPEDKRYRMVQNVGARCDAILEFYLPQGTSDELHEDDAAAAFEKINSAWIFGIATENLMTIKAGDGGNKPVYSYRLHLVCPMSNLGTPHAMDLPLMFGSFKSDRLAALLCGDSSEAIQCSRDMMQAWVSFAKTGNPGWQPFVPHIFGAEPNATFPELGKSIFLSRKEHDLWEGFQERTEIDFAYCRSRARL